MGEALQMTDDATGRLREVETRLAIAARGAKRDPADVKLIAVSKTFEAPAIVPVAASRPAPSSARTACRRRRPNGRR